MTNCVYLIFEQSHCAGCHGWRCTAFGRKKKLSDSMICQNEEEWTECPRYLAATTARPSGIGVLGMPGSMSDTLGELAVAVPQPQALPCEYLGMPANDGWCCHQWCIAGNVAVRSTKVCNSPPSRAECRYYVDGKRRGVKAYAGA